MLFSDRMQHPAKVFFLALSVAAAIPHLLSCASPATDWEKAQYKNTGSAYDAFIQQHPDSEFAGEARKRLDRVSFEEAKRDGSAKSFEGYIGKFPEGQFREEASVLLAKKLNSIEGYETLLSRYSRGRDAEEALQVLEDLYIKKAEKDRTTKAYQSYLARFPGGAHRVAASRAVQYLPIVEACLSQDKQAVARLVGSGQSLASYPEAAQFLMETMQKRLKTSIRVTLQIETTQYHGNGGSLHRTYQTKTLNMVGSFASLSGSSDKFIGFEGPSPDQIKQLLNQFTLLIEAGADPNALRVQGFLRESSVRVPDGTTVESMALSIGDKDLVLVTHGIKMPNSKGVTLHSSGSAGTIVSPEKGGLSALSLAEAADLADYKALLLKYGARP